MAIILKANKVNLFESSVLFLFWYHTPNFLDTPRISNVVDGSDNDALWNDSEDEGNAECIQGRQSQ
jgi:hypothetical protein